MTVFQVLDTVVLPLMEDLSCARSLTVAILWRYRESAQLARLRVNRGDYLDASAYFRAAQATDFLRKLPELPTGIDREAAAKATFFSCERTNAITNARLSRILNDGPFEDPLDLRILDVVERVSKVCRGVLGPLPAFLNARFGPGSTVENNRKLIAIPDKLTGRLCGTGPCLDLLREVEPYSRVLGTVDRLRPLEKVRGNRFFTVPKDGETDRGCGQEPGANVYLQLGAGDAIRTRLHTWGLDLKTAQTRHRMLSEVASRDESLVTIDLKNASNTLAKRAVAVVLRDSPSWLQLLSSLRSPTCEIDGKCVYLEMFSSMGNGFTFELETLVFAVLSWVAIEDAGLSPIPGVNLLVYGDDILVPPEAAPGLVALLAFFGFETNPQKTCLSGPFRESCGGDFWLGRPVRTFQLKQVPSSPAEWIVLANGLRRVEIAFNGQLILLLRAWHCALRRIPTDIRSNRGPASAGDVVIHDHEYSWRLRTEHCIRRVRAWVPFGSPLPWHFWSADVILASALYGADSGGVLLRGNVAGYRHQWISIP